jgi:hypothetical protein
MSRAESREREGGRSGDMSLEMSSRGVFSFLTRPDTPVLLEVGAVGMGVDLVHSRGCVESHVRDGAVVMVKECGLSSPLIGDVEVGVMFDQVHVSFRGWVSYDVVGDVHCLGSPDLGIPGKTSTSDTSIRYTVQVQWKIT